MIKHYMNLHAAPFDMIKQGIKTIELRLYDEKRKQIRVGDEIEFTKTGDKKESLCCVVTALHVFPSFEELYQKLPLLKCGYTEADIDTASPADMELYYSREKQRQYGVLGIDLKLSQGGR